MYECMIYFMTCSISILCIDNLDCEVKVRIFQEKSHLLKLRLGSLLPDFYLHSIQCLLFVQIKLRSPQVVLISQGLQNRIQHLLLEATKFFFSCETNSRILYPQTSLTFCPAIMIKYPCQQVGVLCFMAQFRSPYKNLIQSSI